MSISTDTDALLATTLWGEAVVIVRNTPTFGDTGAPTDAWASIATPNADIQPVDASKQMRQREAGEEHVSTYRVFFPNATAIKAGDRVRRSGWVAGDDELEVQYVMSDEGHVEVFCRAVQGHG